MLFYKILKFNNINITKYYLIKRIINIKKYKEYV